MHEFTFKSLEINLEEKRLVVNGQELPLSFITDFLLEYHDREQPDGKYPSGYWQLEIKRNIVWDAAEHCSERVGS